MNIKVIETCLEKYQIIIRKVRTEFASKIQEFEKFKKLMKKKLLSSASMLDESSHQIFQNDEFSSSHDIQCQYLSSDREAEKNSLQVNDNILS